MLRGWLPLSVAGISVCAAPGCARPLALGSDIIWSSDFESGKLADWSSPADAGGAFILPGDASPDNASLVISDAQAHSGRYSARITSVANLPDPGAVQGGGGGLYRQAIYPEEAYYSAWYYLPRTYQTTTAWVILKFKGVVGQDAGIVPGYAELLDLSLASLPGAGGDMTLVLSDARHQYGTEPRPDPVPHVHINRWFQIEAFYRNTTAPNGELTIWLDGTMIYDVVRPTGPNPWVYFSPCSIVYDLQPTNAEIYIDDVAISWTRVGPGGIVRVAN